MRASRLVSILMRLQSNGRLSARTLANDLGVSPRTIYRDVEALEASGVPITVEYGSSGGFALLEGWRTRLTGLTPEEAQAVMLAGLPGPSSQLGLGEAVASARLKLLAALPTGWQEDAQRISSRFHLDPVGWYRKASPIAHLSAVANAVWTERRIHMRYRSWTATKDRTIEPLGIVLKGGDWYVVAKRGIYRVSNIQALSLGEHFKRPPFDLAARWAESTSRFERELYKATAVVIVTDRGRELLADSSAAVADAIERSKSNRITIPIESIDHAERELLRLGTEVEVLSPPGLRARIASTLARMTKTYAQAPGIRGSGSSNRTAKRQDGSTSR